MLCCIAQQVGLGGLTRLRKLQLGQNRLASLEMLAGLTGLQQLSVEDNELASLAGTEGLAQLLELYAAVACKVRTCEREKGGEGERELGLTGV